MQLPTSQETSPNSPFIGYRFEVVIKIDSGSELSQWREKIFAGQRSGRSGVDESSHCRIISRSDPLVAQEVSPPSWALSRLPPAVLLPGQRSSWTLHSRSQRGGSSTE